MCCLFGIMDNNGSLTSKQKTRLIRALAAESEVRGTDAAGIAYNSGGKLQICKGPGPARKHRFFVPGDARVVMGHTRMTTQGDAKYPQNNHPFAGKVGRLHFALAHNGVLYNDKSLRKSKKLPQTNIQTDSYVAVQLLDSYVAVQLLEQQGALTPDSLSEMAETVEGSFVFTVLDHKDRLYLVKGDNPLTIWHYPRLGLYIYASTLAILHQAVNRTWRAICAPSRTLPPRWAIRRRTSTSCWRPGIPLMRLRRSCTASPAGRSIVRVYPSETVKKSPKRVGFGHLRRLICPAHPIGTPLI